METLVTEGSDTALHHPSKQFHFRYKDLKCIHLPLTFGDTADLSLLVPHASRERGGMETIGALTGLRTNRGWATHPLLICLDGACKFFSAAGTPIKMVAFVKLGHRGDEVAVAWNGPWR